MSAISALFARPIAHRGLHDAPAGVPENSLSAFKAAVAAGYGIECDLQLASDGVPVVFHDAELGRMTGQTGTLDAMTGAALARLALTETDEKIPTVPMLLSVVGGKVPLVVELKRQRDSGAKLAEAAVEVAEGYDGPLAFKSFDPTLVAAVKAAGFTGPVGVVIDAPDETGAGAVAGRLALQHLVHAPAHEFDFLSCGFRALNLPAVELLRRLGKKVMTWTIRDPEDAEKALEAADQIIFEGFRPKV